MEQDVNILMEQYRQGLINLTQNSQLPIGVVRYIFNDVNAMINREHEVYLQEAIATQRKQQEEVIKQQQQEEIPTVAEGEVE